MSASTCIYVNGSLDDAAARVEVAAAIKLTRAIDEEGSFFSGEASQLALGVVVSAKPPNEYEPEETDGFAIEIDFETNNHRGEERIAFARWVFERMGASTDGSMLLWDEYEGVLDRFEPAATASHDDASKDVAVR